MAFRENAPLGPKTPLLEENVEVEEEPAAGRERGSKMSSGGWDDCPTAYRQGWEWGGEVLKFCTETDR